MGRWADPIVRVLNTYSGKPLVDCLETIIKTAEDQARVEARDGIAAKVCEGLHVTPASGLKCRSCYEAEQLVEMEGQVRAEIAIAKKKGEDEQFIDATLVE